MGSPLLDGKVVVVSGVGPGLGYQVAAAAAAAGASVVLGARNDGYLSEVEAEIAATGGAVAACRCDVTSADRLPGVDRDGRRTVRTIGLSRQQRVRHGSDDGTGGRG